MLPPFFLPVSSGPAQISLSYWYNIAFEACLTDKSVGICCGESQVQVPTTVLCIEENIGIMSHDCIDILNVYLHAKRSASHVMSSVSHMAALLC